MTTTQVRSSKIKNGSADSATEAPNLEDAARTASAAIDNEWQMMKKQGQAALSQSESWLRERPLAALGIAAAGGFLLSRLLRFR